VLPEFQTKRAIVEVGRRLWQRGYVAANDGNVSARLPGDRIIVTPTGRSKGFLDVQDLVVVDLEGRHLAGRLAPTSELPMHLFVYRARSDVGAVVHAHPPKATGFAVAGRPLAECVLPEVVLTLGQIPLTEYATPSTGEVPQSIADYVGRYNAVLLRNHGVLTMGRDVEEAYFRMETVEHFAAITLAATALGGPSPLSQEDVRKLLEVREKLGLPTELPACVACGACDGSGTAERPAGQGIPKTSDEEEEVVKAVIREVERALGKGR